MSVDPLAAASVLLGLDLDNPLHAFIEERIEGGDEPPEYVFVGKCGRARVTAKQLTEFRYCDDAITTATGEVVAPINPTNWRQVRRALHKAAKAETLGREAGVAGATRARLIRHLNTHRKSKWHANDDADNDTRTEALQGGYPVKIGSAVWFSIEELLRELEITKVRVDRREITRGLQALGCCIKDKHDYPAAFGGRTSRMMYVVPPDVLREARGERQPQVAD